MNRNIEIEKYRRHNESDRQWQLKKIFIERFINEYDEDRLLCLAQCFVNIQTIGCRYSLKIMNQIQEMTKDLEPHFQEQINLAIKIHKNQNTQSNQTEAKPAKDPKKEDQICSSRKPKLISKTHLVSDKQVQVKQTPKPKIQILTRENNNQTLSNTNQSAQSVSYKSALTSSSSSQQLKPPKTVQSPSVPASTSELAPAASTLPIPYGLSPDIKESSRNVLLKIIKNENKKPNDPLSVLIGPGSPAVNSSQKFEDLKFVRLSKINKIRDVLRSKNKLNDENFDLIEFFDDICSKNDIEIKYDQKFENDLYFGELFIETFRLIAEKNKKKKKCKFNAYKKAYDILISQSELAVKLAKDQSFEYELYGIDIDIISTSDNSKNNINDLNTMLKSMSLPKENGLGDLTLNDSKESRCGDIEEDIDSENRKSPSPNKKEKIKKNLAGFCLFISSDDSTELIDSSNLDNFIHERNSIQILNQSCNKNNCKLEFEIKNKGECDQSAKKIVSGDQIDSENETSGNALAENLKCKCLINGVRISSNQSASKRDLKRISALKAIKYLAKIFPVIKETNYQLLGSQNSSDNSNTKYLKISNEELFGTLAPPTIFETPVNSLDSCSNMANFSNQSFGEKMLKKMGWKGDGHGLGRQEQGILEPVEFVDMNRTRLGFGYNYHFGDGYNDELQELDCAEGVSSLNLNLTEKKKRQNSSEKNQPKARIKIHQFINNIRKLLNDFVQSATEKDLVFDKNLSVEDRKIIHKEAHRYGLKTRSEGNGQNRFIVVRKKKTSSEIFDSIVKNGGELNKFSIISHGE